MSNSFNTYVCIVCGFIYDEAAGRPEIRRLAFEGNRLTEALEFVIRAGVGNDRHEVDHIEVAESAGDVWRDDLAHRGGHAGHLHGADDSAKIINVGLHDIDAVVGDQPAEGVHARLLFAAGHRNIDRIGHGLGFLVPVKGHRLLVEREFVFLEQLAELDAFLDAIGTVRVGVADHLVAKRLSHQRD